MTLLKIDELQLQILPKRASRKDSVVRRVGSDGLLGYLRKYRARLRIRGFVANESKRYPEGIQSLRDALRKGQLDKARARRSWRSETDQRAALKNQRLDKAKARRSLRSEIDQRDVVKTQRLDKARSHITSPSEKAQKPSAPLKPALGKTRKSKCSITSSIEMSTASNLELTRKSKPNVQHQC